MKTSEYAKHLRSEGLKITSQRPGVIAANNGRQMYRYDQTSQGWQRMSLGPVLAR